MGEEELYVERVGAMEGEALLTVALLVAPVTVEARVAGHVLLIQPGVEVERNVRLLAVPHHQVNRKSGISDFLLDELRT